MNILINRPFWQQKIEQAWQQKNIVWLMGARRVGKTSLCQSLANIEYFDCELPRVRLLLEDPEGFLAARAGKRIVLDEIYLYSYRFQKQILENGLMPIGHRLFTIGVISRAIKLILLSQIKKIIPCLL